MALDNTKYDSIIREYDSIRYNHKRELNRRVALVEEKHPDIRRINEQVAELSVKSAKDALFGSGEALTRLNADIAAMGRSRIRLLVGYGYPANYLTLQFSCPDCRDTGFIGTERCHCFNEKIAELVRSSSNISDIAKGETLSHFRTDIYSDEDRERDPISGLTPYEAAEKAVNTACSFIENFNSKFTNLVIMGQTGVGKTHLTNCIAGELMALGHDVQYYTAYRFFDVLGKSKFRSDGFKGGEADVIFDSELLIIDDLGTELVNSFTSSELYAVINERILSGRPTIISTNLSLQSMEELYSERVLSRLSKYYSFIKLQGRDLRMV